MKSASEQQRFHDFGPFRVDAGRRLLLREGAVIPLTPKAFDILLVLLRNSDRVVAKEDLMNLVWPDTVVEENNLTRNISTLRKALEEGPDEHRFVVTVPGRGYQFVSEHVQPQAELILQRHTRAELQIEEKTYEPPTAVSKLKWVMGTRLVWFVASLLLVCGVGVAVYLAHSRPVSSSVSDSIAVLPFDTAENSDFEYLADAMAENTIDQLSQSLALKVISLGSVLQYRGKNASPQEIGHTLGVRRVLMGKVRVEQDHLLVMVELINTADGTHVWGERYNRKLSEVIKVQEEISTEIATRLRAGLTQEEKGQFQKRYTDDFEAYKLYIRGRYYWNKRDAASLQRGLSFFQQAIDRDPTYALAYAGLADSYFVECAAGLLPAQEGMPKAKAAARTALQLDGSLAEAHASLGHIYFDYDWDWAAAEAEYQKAIELSPGYSYAHYFYGTFLLAMSKNSEALTELKRAQELDPLSPMIATFIARSYFYSRDYQRSIDEYRQVLQSNPEFPVAQDFLVETLEKTGSFEQALTQMQTNIQPGEVKRAALRLAYLAGGGRAFLQERIQQISRDPHSQSGGLSGGAAALYSILGDKDQAFAELQNAYERREIWLLYLNVDPVWDNLRADPRFQSIVRQVGLK